MPRRSTPTAVRRHGAPVELLTVLAAAAVATQVKSWAEAVLQPVGERLLPPSAADRTKLGADPDDHPENMPPAELLDQVAQAAGHDPLSDQTRESSSAWIHWVMGLGAGATYGLLADRVPAVRAGRGAAFGAVLFTATHGSLLPVLGLQAAPSQLPRAWWVWEGGSHLVYGIAMDTALALGESVLTPRGRGRARRAR